MEQLLPRGLQPMVQIPLPCALQFWPMGQMILGAWYTCCLESIAPRDHTLKWGLDSVAPKGHTLKWSLDSVAPRGQTVAWRLEWVARIGHTVTCWLESVAPIGHTVTCWLESVAPIGHTINCSLWPELIHSFTCHLDLHRSCPIDLLAAIDRDFTGSCSASSSRCSASSSRCSSRVLQYFINPSSKDSQAVVRPQTSSPSLSPKSVLEPMFPKYCLATLQNLA